MRQTARPLTSTLLRRAAQRAAPRRAAGGPAHEKGSPEFGGFVPPHVATWHKVAGTAFMTTMWLWIFYRAKQDWRHFLGLSYPWEDHGDPYAEDFKATSILQRPAGAASSEDAH